MNIASFLWENLDASEKLALEEIRVRVESAKTNQTMSNFKQEINLWYLIFLELDNLDKIKFG